MKWYLKAQNIPDAEGDRKVVVLLMVAGREAQDVLRTFTFAPARGAGADWVEAESQNDYNLVIRKFTAYCVPRKKCRV